MTSDITRTLTSFISKNWLLLVVVAALLVALVGCGGGSNSNDTVSDSGGGVEEPSDSVTQDWPSYSLIDDVTIKAPESIEILDNTQNIPQIDDPNLVLLLEFAQQDSSLPSKFVLRVTDRNGGSSEIADWVRDERPLYYRQDVVVEDIDVCNESGQLYTSTIGHNAGVYFEANERIVSFEWLSYDPSKLDTERLFLDLVSTISCEVL